MLNKNKNLILPLATVVICIIAILVATNTSRKNKTEQASTNQALTENASTEKNLDSKTKLNDQSQATIASEWQWQTNVNSAQDSLADEEQIDSNTLPFTEKSVHDALQAVKLDENGDVILDHDALVSLDEALERIYNQLDGGSLRELEKLIESSLPGKAGEQTAKLVSDYQGFLQAKERFSQIHEGSGYDANNQQTLATINRDVELYSELQDLRELHLGTETAQLLFHQSDANAEFMFESIKLGMQTDLTPEQIAARQAELEQRLTESLGNSEG